MSIGLMLAGLAVADVRAQTPLTVTAHRDAVRFDLRGGVPLGGGTEDAAPLPTPLALRIVRDEVVAFQLALRGPAGVVAVRTSSCPGLHWSTFEARGVPVARPSASTAVRYLGPGLYPDPLVPTATVSVPAAPGLAVVWVDVWADREAPAGRCAARVEVDGARPVEVAIEVLDLTLPRREVARIGAVSFGSILDRRDRDPRRFDAWMQLAHAHRLAVELMLTRPSTTADGQLDWAAWADAFGPLIDGRTFTPAMGYRGPRQGAPTPRFVVPLSDRWPSPPTEAQLPTDEARWSRELRRWEDEVERRGWFALPDRTEWIVFINKLDEPRAPQQLEALRRYGTLIDAAGLRDHRHVSMRVDGPFGQGAEGWSDARILDELGPAIDLWCACGGTEWSPWSLLEARRAAAPEEGLMFYASNSAGEPATPPLVLDAELIHARAWGWVIARYGLAGALNWEVDFRPGCARDPMCSGYGLNADATLIYRGEELGRGFDTPVPSMRLKTLRRGAQDAALISMLAARDPAAAEALLRRMVPRAMGDGHDAEGAGSWPVDAVVYDRAREYVLDGLLGRSVELDAVRHAPLRWGWIGAGLLLAVALTWLALRRRSAP